MIISKFKDISEDNKYARTYIKLVTRAQSRANSRNHAKQILECVEGHHIIPSSIAPELRLDKDNIAFLSPREHFICHLLLTKCMVDPIHRMKMSFALSMMYANNPNQQRKFSSKLYEYAKRLNAEASSVRSKGKKYKRRKHRPAMSDETRKKIGMANAGRFAVFDPVTLEVRLIHNEKDKPDGWIRGNPNASTNTPRGLKVYHCPKTGDEVKSVSPPEGYVKGGAHTYVTNGSNNIMINFVKDTIPEGYVQGRTISWRSGRKSPLVRTPFGEFELRVFCREYKVDYGFFDLLDIPIRNRKSLEFIRTSLELLGYDPLTQSKREMGFCLVE